jgi:hypothetical protein
VMGPLIRSLLGLPVDPLALYGALVLRGAPR